mmetsp:Transcript_18273/g.52152  ORF Transcript_18273/g.52152 Transcript_18273/m.52152 type:complete len:212 (+) Transcript_18273:330-965(+)
MPEAHQAGIEQLRRIRCDLRRTGQGTRHGQHHGIREDVPHIRIRRLGIHVQRSQGRHDTIQEQVLPAQYQNGGQYLRIGMRHRPEPADDVGDPVRDGQHHRHHCVRQRVYRIQHEQGQRHLRQDAHRLQSEEGQNLHGRFRQPLQRPIRQLRFGLFGVHQRAGRSSQLQCWHARELRPVLLQTLQRHRLARPKAQRVGAEGARRLVRKVGG